MDDDLAAPRHAARTAAQLVLAAALGVSVGLSAANVAWAPTWLPALLVLASVAAGVLRPVGGTVWACALTVLLVASVLVGAVAGERRLETAVLAASSALVHAAAVALPVGLLALALGRRRHRRQGWELARSLAREERSRTEAALVRERSAMAGEIHDTLGHRLTLVSVQLGRLSLDPGLPAEAQQAVEEARRGVAEAAADLGETVQLLKAGGPSRAPADRRLADVVEDARAAGLEVQGDLPASLDDVSAHAYAALVRVLSEALANAARHAPGRPVRLEGSTRDGEAILTVSNAAGPRPSPAPGSSGHGLPSLHHRLALLGGSLEVEHGTGPGALHVVRATVPVDASPTAEGPGRDTLTGVVEAERTADLRTRRARRLTWAVPAALAAAAVVVTLGGFLYLSAASVLPAETFARIQVGMPADEAEELLPPFEMLEAPRGALPVPDGARCSYHEESLSLFSRETVFRVCLADGAVVSTDTVPPR